MSVPPPLPFRAPEEPPALPYRPPESQTARPAAVPRTAPPSSAGSRSARGPPARPKGPSPRPGDSRIAPARPSGPSPVMIMPRAPTAQAAAPAVTSTPPPAAAAPPATPSPAKKEPELLPGWEPATAPDGDTYYYHVQTKETRWDPPYAEPPPPTASAPLPPPPVGNPAEDPANWATATAEDGDVYYYNRVTKETSWDPPACLQKSQPTSTPTPPISSSPASVNTPVPGVAVTVNEAKPLSGSDSSPGTGRKMSRRDRKREEKERKKQEAMKKKEEKLKKKREEKERKRNMKRGSRFGKAKGGKSSMSGFSEEGPTNFSHDMHATFDPVNGFQIDNIPKAWLRLFRAAGIKKAELEDGKTAMFILETVAQNCTAGAKRARGGSKPPSVSDIPPQTKGSSKPKSGGASSAPSAPAAPSPPPPPAPPAAPPPPNLPGSAPAGRRSTGPSLSLAESLAQKKELRHVTEEEKMKSMDRIEASGVLPAVEDPHHMEAVLRLAMKGRRGAMDSDEEEEEEEDDWDDADFY